MLRTFLSLGIGVLLASGSAYGQVANNPNQGKAVTGQGQQAQNYVQGQIIRVDPATGAITLRDAKGKEQVYQTGQATRYYGTDRKALKDGLRAQQFRQGANVMWLGQGNNLSELRLGTAPGTTTAPPPAGTRNPANPGTTNPGTTTPRPGTTNPGTAPPPR